jgi:Flp pilus assembly protein TadG
MAKRNIMQPLTQCYKKLNSPNHKRNKGIALLWATCTLLILILFMGLAIDGGVIHLAANQLQNAADAAALAGAQLVSTEIDGPNTSYFRTRLNTRDFAHANYYIGGSSVFLNENSSNAADGDIVIGLYFPQRPVKQTRFERNDAGFANAVKVVPKCIEGQANPPISLFFGPIVGVNTANVNAKAIAVSIGAHGAGLIVLDPDGDPGLGFSGSGASLHVNNGAIQVNSEGKVGNKGSVWSPAGSVITAEELDICGDDSSTYKGTVPNEPPVFFDVPYMADPLINLPPPPITSDLGTINTGGTYGPGYYSGGIDLSGNSKQSVTLQPGIYVLGGMGLQVNGTKINFTALGVMFYILKDSNKTKIDLESGVNLTITEYKQAGSIYDGMAIFQARDNTNDAKLTGSSTMNLTGTIYIPGNPTIPSDLTITLGGSNYGTGIQVIAWKVSIAGNSDITINYDGRNFKNRFRSFLVE